MKWHLKRFDEKDMPQDLDADIRRGLCTAFPEEADSFAKARGWHGSNPEFSIVAQSGDDGLAGHVGVVERAVKAGEQLVIAGGIQNVFVVRDMRGSGLSGDLVRAAVAEMARRDYDCGLLFCVPALEKVYAPMGWRHLAGRRILRRTEGKTVPLSGKNILMFYPLKTFSLPPADIDLQGNDW